jgi:hypothetical protein
MELARQLALPLRIDGQETKQVPCLSRRELQLNAHEHREGRAL